MATLASIEALPHLNEELGDPGAHLPPCLRQLRRQVLELHQPVCEEGTQPRLAGAGLQESDQFGPLLVTVGDEGWARLRHPADDLRHQCLLTRIEWAGPILDRLQIATGAFLPPRRAGRRGHLLQILCCPLAKARTQGLDLGRGKRRQQGSGEVHRIAGLAAIKGVEGAEETGHVLLIKAPPAGHQHLLQIGRQIGQLLGPVALMLGRQYRFPDGLLFRLQVDVVRRIELDEKIQLVIGETGGTAPPNGKEGRQDE